MTETGLTIILSVIGLVGTVITSLLIPYIKSKTTSNQQEILMYWVRIGVKASEQLYKKGGQGEIKKEYVRGFLKKLGINITEDQINALIEACVNELNKTKQLSR